MLCVHCQEGLHEQKRLCDSCLKNLTLASREGRCPRCFHETQGKKCNSCILRGSPFRRSIAAFELFGPAQTIHQQFYSGRRPEFAQDLASWMVVQFLQLEIPPPELIVPAPEMPMRSFFRGFQPHKLLATEVAKLLECPVFDMLKVTLVGKVACKKHCALSDKHVLVVSSMLEDSLRLCAEALSEIFPSRLSALAAGVAL